MNFQCSKMQCLLGGLMLLVLHVETITLCGPELDEFLQQMCKNGFNSKMKRGYGKQSLSNRALIQFAALQWPLTMRTWTRSWTTMASTHS